MLLTKENTLVLISSLTFLKSTQAVPTASSHIHRRSNNAGTCAFPEYENMVAVQTNGTNAGWAMHYDQLCSYGSWCPYSCKPGQLMGQWDPSVTTYSYPGSQNGGLYCDSNGVLQKPIPENDYCYDGKGTVVAINNVQGSGDVAFCQTVLPGNEEMLIPTLVSDNETLAVPGTEYWAGTASHFYINPPGVSVDDGCKWGTKENPWGNWAPYVAGANMDKNGDTFVKIGWNPVYLEEATPFKDELPTFGVRITCDDESQCEGLECSITPSIDGVNGVSSPGAATGAGGGNFCVITAKNGAIAKIEVFEDNENSIPSSTNEKRDYIPYANKTGIISSFSNISNQTTTLSPAHSTVTTIKTITVTI
ncbi:uncharacterized protein NDAI_0K00770 [Naumovozyma dairenensis CBS 421]|uniref:Uncharacterized protein n=1 Tax=Naumovozyma dairenensis (strain ATCC 10597 / BCRC 20456 / CBS 421 / NBRC 0211 / NRRL Y-12639) TaxID=1071378 RepID=G0WHK7_NAUDC|nr:hypothetical protein NDAI_0K00770 [Naumovozyma dairenensis CBS 421]CCD27268.1 hypothetical protein NDAI_0K00770 [Naumovozyma dairenensis CBS 421]